MHCLAMHRNKHKKISICTNGIYNVLNLTFEDHDPLPESVDEYRDRKDQVE